MNSLEKVEAVTVEILATAFPYDPPADTMYETSDGTYYSLNIDRWEPSLGFLAGYIHEHDSDGNEVNSLAVTIDVNATLPGGGRVFRKSTTS